MSTGETRVDFVCFKSAHYRRCAAATSVCHHLGFPAYCPAGDVGEHEWVALSTDLERLARLGYAGQRVQERTASEDRSPVLIR